MVSRLLRAALAGESQEAQAGETKRAGVAGFRPFAAADQKLVTNEQIDQLRDREGL
jgi:hypothetical protein